MPTHPRSAAAWPHFDDGRPPILVVRLPMRKVSNSPSRYSSAHHACPKCASRAVRTHRDLLDRCLGLLILMRTRRYTCTGESCGWSGLLADAATPGSPRYRLAAGDPRAYQR